MQSRIKDRLENNLDLHEEDLDYLFKTHQDAILIPAISKIFEGTSRSMVKFTFYCFVVYNRNDLFFQYLPYLIANKYHRSEKFIFKCYRLALENRNEIVINALITRNLIIENNLIRRIIYSDYSIFKEMDLIDLCTLMIYLDNRSTNFFDLVACCEQDFIQQIMLLLFNGKVLSDFKKELFEFSAHESRPIFPLIDRDIDRALLLIKYNNTGQNLAQIYMNNCILRGESWQDYYPDLLVFFVKHGAKNIWGYAPMRRFSHGQLLRLIVSKLPFESDCKSIIQLKHIVFILRCVMIDQLVNLIVYYV